MKWNMTTSLLSKKNIHNVKNVKLKDRLAHAENGKLV